MKVLLTGASGFLGTHLAELFVGAGHSVRALVRRTSRTDRLERLGVELVRGDMKDADSLRRAVEGVEVVVHAASTMAGVPEEYVAATVEGTRSLLAAADQAGVHRVVYVSSIAVYPMRKLPPGQAVAEDSGYEEDPLFLTNYTKSKIGADRAALECAARGKMQVFVLRPGLLYGPRGPWTGTARLRRPSRR
jgi:nucleoside-diphosphate-sugar epimerase